MRNLLLATVALFPAAASATPVTGLIDFTGSNRFNIAAKTITFVGKQSATSDTGSLALFGTCDACAEFKNINFGAGFTPVSNEIVANNNGLSFALDLEKITSASAISNFVDVKGDAVLHLTGFSPTPGTFFFSTQGPEGPIVSFSTTALSSIPEPGAILLFGLGLLGLGFVRIKSTRAFGPG
jgi:PEP-CTERM motif